MEASVVVCEPLKPPCFCHTENQPEVHKTATQKRARGAMRGARGAFVSLYGSALLKRCLRPLRRFSSTVMVLPPVGSTSLPVSHTHVPHRSNNVLHFGDPLVSAFRGLAHQTYFSRWLGTSNVGSPAGATRMAGSHEAERKVNNFLLETDASADTGTYPAHFLSFCGNPGALYLGLVRNVCVAPDFFLRNAASLKSNPF